MRGAIMLVINKTTLLKLLKRVDNDYKELRKERFSGIWKPFNYFVLPGKKGKARKAEFDKFLRNLESETNPDMEHAFCRLFEFYLSQPSGGRLMAGLEYLIAKILEIPNPHAAKSMVEYNDRMRELNNTAVRFLKDRGFDVKDELEMKELRNSNSG